MAKKKYLPDHHYIVNLKGENNNIIFYVSQK